jgi:hypothetical protein
LGVSYANDSSVVAEYYIDNAEYSIDMGKNKDYKMLKLIKILRPMPQVSLSKYERQFFELDVRWDVQLSIPLLNLNFSCYDSYDTERKVKDEDKVTGLKLRLINYFLFPKK